MTPNKESLERFKSIYRAEFGVDLSDDEAVAKAERLLRLIRLLRRPLTSPNLDDSARPFKINDEAIL